MDAAKKRMGVTTRSDVLRSLVTLLSEAAPTTLADIHAYLLTAHKGGDAPAGVLAERLEGVMRCIDPTAAALWAEQRQRAQAGGGA